MEDSGNGDKTCGVIHFVDDPVIANPEAEIATAALQLLGARQPRVLRQIFETVTNSLENARRQWGEVTLRTRGQLDSIGH